MTHRHTTELVLKLEQLVLELASRKSEFHRNTALARQFLFAEAYYSQVKREWIEDNEKEYEEFKQSLEWKD